MDAKPRPNRQTYLRTLQGMTSQEKFRKAVELSEFAKRQFRDGLRKQFADLSDEDFHRLYLARLAKCHNRNY